MKLELEIGGERRTFTIGRDGREVQVTDEHGQVVRVNASRLDGNLWELVIGDRRLRLAGSAVDTERRTVWLNGRTMRVRRVPPGGRAASGPAADAAGLSATIPSVVREILVKVGDPVAPGDKLILLESMKMVIPIVAHQAGTVRAILCAPGESVLPGVPLLEVSGEGQSETRPEIPPDMP